ncbi:type IX secretion system membrane protein PorP/SprF [Zeaxanthinibacter enoshimensis]|uniref:PorP/SprF family type IX secretion system membrane protein n=1 Tax=Zeaxanthinibacter enoshimensis TaxID=392009 RepID=UPI00356721DD
MILKFPPIKILLILFGIYCGYAQQNPQFTQYQFNPMTVNAGYTGSRGDLTLMALYRSQWSGIEGAPRTMTFSVETPVGTFDGLGLSIIQDELGPSQETYMDANYAHTLLLNSSNARLGLGIKAGVRLLSIDWSKGNFRDPEAVFNTNINSKLLPNLGAGGFFYSDKSYLGFSIPNLIPNVRYEEFKEAEETERIQYYLIGGHVFELGSDIKFKPSFYLKYVRGNPLSKDVSANFLLFDTFSLGANYRFDESLSGVLGMEIAPGFIFGYAYDYNTNELSYFNSGSHEIFLRYQLVSKNTILKSPRFF